MAINHLEFCEEEVNLTKNIKKIDLEIGFKDLKDKELEDKIARLNKESHGSYSEELEVTKKLFDITHKNLLNYSDSKNNPYFAKIDFREYKKDRENYFIGKFAIGESKSGDEIVIDWRAPIADLYYSGLLGDSSYEAPVGWINGELFLKRKFIIREGKLIDAFDEGGNELILKSNDDENSLVDEFLKLNLEESLSSKLKEVVATIQKEQNDIIRASINGPLIIQGSAGSGKTTVALHRLAYILYKHRNTLKGEDILVLGPNGIFLDYISNVLPSLGIDDVKQSTIENLALAELKLKYKVITRDFKLSALLEMENTTEKRLIEAVSKIKGSTLFKRIIDRYIRYLEINDGENIKNIMVDEFTLFDESEIKRLYLKDLVNLPLDKRKEEIKRYFKLKKKEKIKEYYEKISFYYDLQILRLKKSKEDSEERRIELIGFYDLRDSKKNWIIKNYDKVLDGYFSSWSHFDIEKLYYDMFLQSEVFEKISEGSISNKFCEEIIQRLKENKENKVVDIEDLIPILYLKYKILGTSQGKKFKHIVVDEAQDYSLFAFELIKELSLNNSYTIVGDLGQGIYYYNGISDWQELINKVFNENNTYIALKQSYRSTVEIIEVANSVLENQKLNVKPSIPVLRHGIKPDILEFKDLKEFSKLVDEIATFVKDQGKNSVAIICKNNSDCKKVKDILKKNSVNSWNYLDDKKKEIDMKFIILPVYMAKGLEFDASIIYNCNIDTYKNTMEDSKLLYVALSRALHFEYILYNGELSTLLK